MQEEHKSLRELTYVRWGVLLIVSLIMAANYYFYDALSPLKDLMQSRLGFSNQQYGFLQSTYSISNVFLFMAVIGGILLDKWGIRFTGIGFTCFMAAGSILTYYGSSETFRNGGPGYDFFNSFMTGFSPEFKLMTVGYFFFGLGAETSIVVITTIVVKWFKGKELALALGLNLAVARLGQAMSFYFSSNLSTEDFWNRPIFLSACLLSTAFLFFLIYSLIDFRLDRQIKFRLQLDDAGKFKISDVLKIIRIPSFIYITLLCVTFYSAFFPFLKYATDLLHNKFSITTALAGKLTSIPIFCTVLFTPFFGWIADIKGKSASMMVFSSILLIVAHLTLTFTMINPIIPMALLGIAFSLIPAAMWPGVAKIIDQNKLGTAYGIMFSVQNFGLWLFPILIGIILDRSNPGVTAAMVEEGAAKYNYTYAILMLAMIGVVGIVFALLLKREDKTSGFGLELPNKKIKD
ncbi:MAG TPA: MFS transporter [Bacteroidales bacterium]|nr:MFS transporter [Bacteroidales bacterium]